MAFPVKKRGGKKTNRLVSCGFFVLIFMLVLGINMQEYKSIKKIKNLKETGTGGEGVKMEYNPERSNMRPVEVLPEEEDEKETENSKDDDDEDKAAEEEKSEEEDEEEKETNFVERENNVGDSKDNDNNASEDKADDKNEDNDSNASEDKEEDKKEDNGNNASEDKEEEKSGDNDNNASEDKAEEKSDTATEISRPEWWDSSKSTVIALAAGYGLGVYHQLVGSLRKTGYEGHIILGVAPNLPADITDYFKRMDVIWKEVPITTDCTYAGKPMQNGQPAKELKCPEAYPDYKMSWGRFPLARDWLLECEDCTGGVMLTDARDSYFQSDPFAYPFGDKPLEQLPGEVMVFEEISTQRTSHWLTYPPVNQCRNVKLTDYTMLCSGSTMGTRQGILDYIDVMVKEFDYWKDHDECRNDGVGDDQAIHNYLFYTQQVKNAVAIPHRTGPIHVAGVQADKVFRATIKKVAEERYDNDLQKAESFVNRFGYTNWSESDNDSGGRPKEWRTWLPPEHELIDAKTGFITNFDGKPSPQVHQFDRFGLYTSSQFIMDLMRVD